MSWIALGALAVFAALAAIVFALRCAWRAFESTWEG